MRSNQQHPGRKPRHHHDAYGKRKNPRVQYPGLRQSRKGPGDPRPLSLPDKSPHQRSARVARRDGAVHGDSCASRDLRWRYAPVAACGDTGKFPGNPLQPPRAPPGSFVACEMENVPLEPQVHRHRRSPPVPGGFRLQHRPPHPPAPAALPALRIVAPFHPLDRDPRKPGRICPPAHRPGIRPHFVRWISPRQETFRTLQSLLRRHWGPVDRPGDKGSAGVLRKGGPADALFHGVPEDGGTRNGLGSRGCTEDVGNPRRLDCRVPCRLSPGGTPLDREEAEGRLGQGSRLNERP